MLQHCRPRWEPFEYKHEAYTSLSYGHISQHEHVRGGEQVRSNGNNGCPNIESITKQAAALKVI